MTIRAAAVKYLCKPTLLRQGDYRQSDALCLLRHRLLIKRGGATLWCKACSRGGEGGVFGALGKEQLIMKLPCSRRFLRSLSGQQHTFR